MATSRRSARCWRTPCTLSAGGRRFGFSRTLRDRAYLHLLKAHVRAYYAIKALQPEAHVSFAHHMALCKVSTERVLAVRGDNAAAMWQADYFYHQHFFYAVIDGRVDVAIQHEPARRRCVLKACM